MDNLSLSGWRAPGGTTSSFGEAARADAEPAEGVEHGGSAKLSSTQTRRSPGLGGSRKTGSKREGPNIPGWVPTPPGLRIVTQFHPPPDGGVGFLRSAGRGEGIGDPQ